MSMMQAIRTGAAPRRWALVPLRLAVGFGFAFHGYAKLARGPASFAAVLAAIGVPAPTFVAWVTSLLEALGGVALMLGAFVLPLTPALIAIMATAMFAVHFQYGYSSVRLQGISGSGAQFGPIGYELNLLYIAALLALAASGASPLSVDRWLDLREPGRRRALSERGPGTVAEGP